jgi:hypothetical protein
MSATRLAYADISRTLCQLYALPDTLMTPCSTAGMQDIAADDLKLAAGLYGYARGGILCRDAHLSDGTSAASLHSPAYTAVPASACNNWNGIALTAMCR